VNAVEKKKVILAPRYECREETSFLLEKEKKRSSTDHGRKDMFH